MEIKLSQADESKLSAKVAREYQEADTYTRTWKQDVKDVANTYLLPKASEDKIKVKRVANNLTIRLSTFVGDELTITNVPIWGVLWQEQARNTDKVFQANFESMDIKSKYRAALIDDWLYGVWVLAVDGWNDYAQEPIVSYIDSRLTFPDPKNWQDSQLRFFWTKLRKSIYELEVDDAYDIERVQKVKWIRDQELQEVDRLNSQAKWFSETFIDDDWLIDIYNHLTVFRTEDDDAPSLYLTTWWADRSTLIRCIKMRALSDAERADPSKIDFWVKLFRAKPLPWSYAWMSLVDEVGNEQDLETLLMNLQIEQAKEAAVWWKTFVHAWLWIDIDQLANNTWPWAVIPYSTTDMWLTAQNGIYQEPNKPQNPIIQNTMSVLQRYWQENSSISWIALWQSLPWWQTKAETQTLQQNINQVLSYMASNYMDSLKSLWESIYRSYAANMSPQRRKNITIVDEAWNVDSYWFKKNEFISGWDVYIRITSKAQESIKKQKALATLLSVMWILKQSVTPWSYQDNVINRLLIENSWLEWITPELLYPLSKDERKAYRDVEILNRNKDLKSKPQPWEDHNLFINIYKKGLDTPARANAIRQREKLLQVEWEQPVAPQEWGKWIGWLWASMVASQFAQQQATEPSLQDVQV